MWAWYLEWSTIARAAIKDRGLLSRLGFLSSSPARGGAGSGVVEDEDDDGENEDGDGDGDGDDTP